jgi:hypothetical protein
MGKSAYAEAAVVTFTGTVATINRPLSLIQTSSAERIHRVQGGRGLQRRRHPHDLGLDDDRVRFGVRDRSVLHGVPQTSR